MNSYERAMAVFHGEIPDRVPTFELMIDPKVIRELTGTDSYMELCDQLDIDLVITNTPSKMYRETCIDAAKQIYRNEWGMLRQYNGEVVSAPLHGPVETLEDALKYEAPDPTLEFRFDNLRELVKRFKGCRLIGFHLHDGFNYSYYLTSMEDMMCNLYDEPELIQALVDKAIDHNLRLAERALDIGADFVLSGDDYGAKTGLLVSREHFEEYFFPGLRQICDYVTGRGALMLKHCCGNINPILGDLVDFGITGLHPLDENAGINQVSVKEKFPNLTVIGGIDCDKPLTEYSTDEMKSYVKGILATHAVGGRYICATSNSVHSSAKPENFRAMQEAVHEFGRYRTDGTLDWMQ